MTTPVNGIAPCAPDARAAWAAPHPIEEDRAFCADTLPRVSRTFALSIRALPPRLGDPVCVAYLLCRIVDTIEDDARLDGPTRERLFDAFDHVVADPAAGLGELERLVEAFGLGETVEERGLCAGAGRVFRCFRALPARQRAAISPHIMEMSCGMREYAGRAGQGGRVRIRDLDDLERYCHFVAGTVGKLLTGLFEHEVPDLSESARKSLRARAVSFGQGLQLVNIVKDVATDFERGVCYLPEELAEKHGVDPDELLDVRQRAAALRVVADVCACARDHLRRAEEYTLLWPAGTGRDIRMFCAVPLALALATLHEVEHGEDTLVRGLVPKVSRECVGRVFTDARLVAASDDALREALERYAAGSWSGATEPGAPSPSVNGHAAAIRRYQGKVLVTGAAGHLGANLVHRLLEDGRDVRVLLRPQADNLAMDGLPVERVFGDLRDPAAVRLAVRGCETVFHAAANVSTLDGDAAHKREIYDCNVIGTRNLLRAAREHAVARVVVTGSFSAVGFDPDDPSRPSDETMPFYPFVQHLPYGHTKLLVEHECLRATADGLDVVVCISTAILGPRDYKPSRMGRALIDFSHRRVRAYIPGGFEFVAARDITSGHMLAMESGRSGQRYIVSTQFLAVDDLMGMFEEVTGVPRPRLRLPSGLMQGLSHVSTFVLSRFFPRAPQRLTPGAVRILRLQRRADIGSARRELGYEPTSIQDAIRDAYADFGRRGLVPRISSPPPMSRPPIRAAANVGASTPARTATP